MSIYHPPNTPKRLSIPANVTKEQTDLPPSRPMSPNLQLNMMNAQDKEMRSKEKDPSEQDLEVTKPVSYVT